MKCINDDITPALIVSKDGIILDSNEATEKYIGYTIESLRGKKICSLLNNISLSSNYSDVTLSCSSGTKLNLLAIISRIVDDKCNLVKYIVSLADIEKLPTIASRLSAERSKVSASKEELQQFVSCVSHDLRSPLVSIEGFIVEIEELINDLKDNEEMTCDCNGKRNKVLDEFCGNMEEAIGFVVTSVQRLKRLVCIIVDLHKNNKRKLVDKPVDIKSIIQMLLTSMQHQIDKTNCNIRISETLPIMTVDQSVAERIFGNILDNAVKYLDPNRPGQIDIDYYVKDQSIIFSIKDNGIGICEHNRKYVFQPFRRATDRDVPGDGVGMPMVRSLVDLYSGDIWFNSKEDRGTTFYISFPKAMIT